MERAIGVFDSGVGGLTVLNSIKSLLPNENIIYIGDNYHCPYGDKTPAQLFKYASGIVEYFIKQNVKLIVLACNTTSSTVLERLQMTYPEVMIIGVIDATVNDFINRKVANTLIIATVATIKSNKYPETIKQIDYPILKEQIENVLPNIEYVSSSEAISKSVKDILLRKKLLNFNKCSYTKIYTTGDVDEFIYSSSGFFDYTNLKVEHLIID